MAAYAQLARLPQPQYRAVQLGALARRVAALETRVSVSVEPGPELTVQADPDQLEQLLINLLRNGADAALQAHPPGAGDGCAPAAVRLSWMRQPPMVELRMVDNGPGLANTANLFVPFFTTKPNGSGIGLALSRQIAEAHQGSLVLENRPDGPGCVARLLLPVEPAAS
jgi:signal transduction histidine kinase